MKKAKTTPGEVFCPKAHVCMKHKNSLSNTPDRRIGSGLVGGSIGTMVETLGATTAAGRTAGAGSGSVDGWLTKVDLQVAFNRRII